MLRWAESTHGGAVLVRKDRRSWDTWLAVYKPVVWLAQPKISFLADPLDWWFDVWGVQWGVGLGKRGASDRGSLPAWPLRAPSSGVGIDVPLRTKVVMETVVGIRAVVSAHSGSVAPRILTRRNPIRA